MKSKKQKSRSSAMSFLPDPKDYPSELYVSNETYRLIFVKGLDHFGETCPETRTIKIKQGMSRRATFETLVHELLHMVEFEHNIPLKHKVVYKLERAIVELLLDNFFSSR